MFLLREFIKSCLNERRRAHDPDRNQTNLEILQQYIQQDVFFRATNHPDRQGININAEYPNPLGIYAYPLTKEYLQYFLQGELPHAEDIQKYAIILTPKNKNSLVKASTYTWDQLQLDCEKLGADFEDVRHGKGPMTTNNKIHPIHGLLYLIFGKKIISKNRTLANQNLRKLGYSGIYSDNNLYAISYDTGSEVIFVGSDAIEIIDIVQNPNYNNKVSTLSQYLRKQKFNFINSTREEQIQSLKQNPILIKTLKNPDEELQMIAIQKNPSIWMYINNPVEKVLKIAKQHDPFYSDYKPIK